MCDKKGVFVTIHIFVIQLQFVTYSYLKTLIPKTMHCRKKLEDFSILDLDFCQLPTMPERVYKPITGMGYLAMFTFQLDNTKR